MSRKIIGGFVVVGAVLAVCAFISPAVGQITFNEREIKSIPTTGDKADVWALDFRFKNPRYVKVNVPGKGTRIYMYLWYQVINRTGKPRVFVPDFELVTLDFPAVFPDEISALVQDAVKKIEDPTGYQNIKNSVTITKEPIPPSKPAGEAFPRAVTGVALWDATAAEASKRDPKLRDLAHSTNFSIFVRGLSNGYVRVDPIAKGLPPVTRYKTLQLNFKRTGDRNELDARNIEFAPPAEWIYRSIRLKSPLKGK